MTKLSLKDIVAHIKTAVAPPPPPSGHVAPEKAAPPKPSKPTAAPAPGAAPVKKPVMTADQSKSIRLMQQAVQSVFDAANGNPEFTSYLFQNYKLQSEVTELLKEPVAMDGIWGPATTRALYGAGWIAKGVVDALNDFGGVAPNSKTAFRDADLQQLKSLLPRTKNPHREEKEGLPEKAEALNKVLDKLTYFIQNYSKQVMESDTFKQMKDKDRVVLSLMPGVPANIQEKFGKYLNNEQFLQQSNISGLNLPDAQNKPVKANVNLLTLSNPLYFQNFLKQYLGYSEEQARDPKLQNNILGSIQQQINARLSQWKKPEATET